MEDSHIYCWSCGAKNNIKDQKCQKCHKRLLSGHHRLYISMMLITIILITTLVIMNLFPSNFKGTRTTNKYQAQDLTDVQKLVGCWEEQTSEGIYYRYLTLDSDMQKLTGRMYMETSDGIDEVQSITMELLHPRKDIDDKDHRPYVVLNVLNQNKKDNSKIEWGLLEWDDDNHFHTLVTKDETAEMVIWHRQKRISCNIFLNLQK